MLILTRMPGEQIRIGDDVVIEVMRAGDVQVSLGIEAPRSVSVLRAELLPQPLEAPGDGGLLARCDA